MLKIDNTSITIGFLLLFQSFILLIIGYLSASSNLFFFSIGLSAPFLLISIYILYSGYVEFETKSKSEIIKKVLPDDSQKQLSNAVADFTTNLLKSYPKKYSIKIEVKNEDLEKATVPIIKNYYGMK
jgi:hypothetical protein